ncbi:GSCFA domain-containing protein [Brucella pituitosa]|uniref:GSCFA domain-containing protein n=1 Tax=Brucella pituitosa TaxID=571256 RepID=UPI003F4AF62E
MHPYNDIKDYQHWVRSFRGVEIRDVDPTVDSNIKIGKADAIVTAGSCFAQHISRRLAKSGYNYLVTEKLPETLNKFAPKDIIDKHNYGTYTARYGNIYTPRQLLQLFLRAYGIFNPVENYWLDKKQRFIDPFRPQIQPGGFNSLEELVADREVHYNAVRTAFERADWFVFTLGLTETFVNKFDGSVYPVAPGVAGGEFDKDQHEFVNFDVAAVYHDLEEFYKLLKTVNRNCRVLVTVSPVPLMATKEDRHVLVSTTYSKSVLRVCCDMFERAYKDVMYFPSYEIITGNFTKGEYYEGDLRLVKDAGVDHVMRLFLKRMTNSSTDGSESERSIDDVTESNKDEIEDLSQIACDEELLRNI